jgi:hypothetical protein
MMTKNTPPDDGPEVSGLLFRGITAAREKRKLRFAKRVNTTTQINGGIFPSEAEIARRLSQDVSTWKQTSIVLEREGFPRIDPIMRGRYWPAVIAWWHRRYGLTNLTPSQLDGEEDLNVLR